MKVVVTGANGHLGSRLVRQLGETHDVRAIVRSERARNALASSLAAEQRTDIRVVDYNDAAALATAIDGFEVVVHLVGIIKESRSNPFHLAHEGACAALVTAAGEVGLGHIVNLGIIGSDANSTNACFASRGRSEEILASGPASVTLLRVPMVLGEGDFASFALGKQARRKLAVTFRAGSKEQPIYVDDVIAALANALNATTPAIIELAGPESLTRRALIARASAILGRPAPLIISIPLGVGLALAWLLERLPNPPVTRSMLGVLDHDDTIDATAAATALGVRLTPLDDMLARVLRNPAAEK